MICVVDRAKESIIDGGFHSHPRWLRLLHNLAAVLESRSARQSFLCKRNVDTCLLVALRRNMCMYSRRKMHHSMHVCHQHVYGQSSSGHSRGGRTGVHSRLHLSLVCIVVNMRVAQESTLILPAPAWASCEDVQSGQFASVRT